MLKILKYSFFDLMRSRWSYVYLAFYLLLGTVLLFLNNDLSKAVITLMNVIIVLVPLIAWLIFAFANIKHLNVLFVTRIILVTWVENLPCCFPVHYIIIFDWF